jgi:hypothetical protein
MVPRGDVFGWLYRVDASTSLESTLLGGGGVD